MNIDNFFFLHNSSVTYNVTSSAEIISNERVFRVVFNDAITNYGCYFRIVITVIIIVFILVTYLLFIVYVFIFYQSYWVGPGSPLHVIHQKNSSIKASSLAWSLSMSYDEQWLLRALRWSISCYSFSKECGCKNCLHLE